METSKIILEGINQEYFFNRYFYLLFETLIEKYDIDNYIKAVSMDYEMNALGSYHPNTKEIKFNPNRILKNTWESYEKYFTKSNTNIVKLHNLYTIISLYHEIEHIIQTKEADSKLNDSLHIIIKEGLELGRRHPDNLTDKEKLLYKKNYNQVLTERNAQIMSFYKLLEENKNNKFLSKKELLFFRKWLYNLMISGYTNETIPVETYYNLRGKQEEYKLIPFTEEYSNIEKISWGLEVEDIKKVTKSIIK